MAITDRIDERELLAASARRLFDEAGAVGRARELRDDPDTYFARSLWLAMGELGWPAIAIPEASGGAGSTIGTMLGIFEASGRALSPEPLLSTAALGAQLLALADPSGPAETWLRAVADDGAILAVAGVHEFRSTRPARADIRIHSGPGGITVDGWAGEVLDAPAADAIVVVTADQGAVILPTEVRGLRIVRQRLIDNRGWGRLEFDGLRLPSSARLVEPGAPLTPVERAIDLATTALCAEMLGGMWEAFDRTLAYTKDRMQFGRPIASYQAVQHRLARLHSELLVTDAAIRSASQDVDGSVAAVSAVSAAKVRASSTARMVSREAIQLHGGIGVTDDCDIGLFVKRLRVSEFLFGDENWHADRWARCHGY